MNGKLIAGVVTCAVLAAAVVGGATFTGSQVKKQLRALPQVLETQWPVLKVVNQRYDKHLFSATHTVTLQVGCASASGDEPLTLTLVQHIQHGPLPTADGIAAAVIDTELVLSEAQSKKLAELTVNQPPLTAHTVVELTGAHHTHVAMPQFRLRGPKGEQFDWQGLQVDLDARGPAFNYEVSMPGAKLSLHDEKMALDFKFANAQMHGTVNGDGTVWLRPGTAAGELALLELTATAPGAPTPTTLSLSKLKLSGTSTLDNGLLSATSRLTGGGSVGDAKLDLIELRASIKRLHVAGYEQLLRHMMELSNSCDTGQTAIAPQALWAQIQHDVAALLPYKPEYSIDTLALEVDGKRGEASYSVGLNAASEAELKLPLPTLLMSKAQLRGQIKLPLPWVERVVAHLSGMPEPAAQAEMINVMLTQMTTDGFIVRDGDMLSTQFSLDQGQIEVNGKSLGSPGAGR